MDKETINHTIDGVTYRLTYYTQGERPNEIVYLESDLGEDSTHLRNHEPPNPKIIARHMFVTMYWNQQEHI
jgi:hypothetical protein